MRYVMGLSLSSYYTKNLLNIYKIDRAVAICMTVVTAIES